MLYDTVQTMFHLTEAVRDPIWKNIYLTPELLAASRSSAFCRLARIKQLGPTELVYPGATHTRAAHSYGVYHTALRLLNTLLSKGAASWVTKQGTASFLAAALFHDLGHFPFTHSLKELPLRDHEDLTADCIRSEPLASLIAATGADPQQSAAIVSHSEATQDTETLFFRKLLSGVLDPDKLDYLNRDAFFCGVPYGIQDTDFILSKLIPHKEQGILLDSAGIMSVEHLLFSKYLMYRSVYWHKNVRIATAMMKKVLYAALHRGCIQPEELYALDDTNIFSLIESRNFPEKSCAAQLVERKLFTTAAEIPFSDENEAHTSLEDLSKRTEMEHVLAEKAGLSPCAVLIDIPERISFESSLWIQNEHCTFSESSTVFKRQTVDAFTQTLRIIRVAAAADTPQEKLHKLQESGIAALNGTASLL